MTARLTEKQVVAALDRLSAGWPEGYVLFSASGSLCLLAPGASNGDFGFYQSKMVKAFPGITNDGGDPDWISDEDGVL